MLFIQKQATYLNIETPVITFDQPLWLKATETIISKSLDIVCQVGGFHLLMSFLGSVGKIMEKSVIEELLQTIYGTNAVSHILSGKAFARSLRGHLLLQSALELIILNITSNPIFDIDEVELLEPDPSLQQKFDEKIEKLN